MKNQHEEQIVSRSESGAQNKEAKSKNLARFQNKLLSKYLARFETFL